jgi:hypothetical protein
MLKAPFPWFGGKSRVASVVWERFGDVANYVEPFAGSLAVLLGRPHPARTETVNDLDCYVANFWRALQAEPDEVARWADWPVNEADLHARHRWLVGRAEFRERMKTEPDFYDVKVAGWWVWGLCAWIGHGWCRADRKLSRQLPHLGNPGMGVHAPSRGLFKETQALAERLRRVRIVCGDWVRVMGPSPTFRLALTGVFLDPPYSERAGRADVYAREDLQVADRARAWCLDEIRDTVDGFEGPRYLHPNLRIAFCGYEGEHVFPDDWDCVAWKASAGYGSQRRNGKNTNPARERIWFSPGCLRGGMRRMDVSAMGVEGLPLFEGLGAGVLGEQISEV